MKTVCPAKTVKTAISIVSRKSLFVKLVMIFMGGLNKPFPQQESRRNHDCAFLVEYFFVSFQARTNHMVAARTQWRNPAQVDSESEVAHVQSFFDGRAA